MKNWINLILIRASKYDNKILCISKPKLLIVHSGPPLNPVTYESTLAVVLAITMTGSCFINGSHPYPTS